jgi:ribosomal protein S18 acetylase RimI-like enzyme
MSPPGRPKGEYRSAQHEGNPVSPPGRPKGECRSAQLEGGPVPARPATTPAGAWAGALRCAPMTAATRAGARALLSAFLRGDDHYRASSGAYGDGGDGALDRALELFLARPELGFVWVAEETAADAAGGTNLPAAAVVGVCVVCYAISTSRGGVVAKLDDVSVASGATGRGIGTAMLEALAAHLSARGVTRIDCGCHRDNGGAWRFYERLGFVPLDEERIARLL